jgi:hypothetical protein
MSSDGHSPSPLTHSIGPFDAPAPSTVAAVIERMRAIEAALPPTDGIACFNHLYLAVTEGVQAAIAAGQFHETPFLTKLDVVFAALYFDALAALARGEPAPPAWRPLFEARADATIAPIQFALAGMNAHINRDLPLALVASWPSAPSLGSPEHADFQQVNRVLATVEAAEHSLYFRGLLGARELAHAENAVSMWSVEAAREAAWVNGEVLWALGGSKLLAGRFVDALDGTVELAGRGLLTPDVR